MVCFIGRKPHLGCDSWTGQCHHEADTCFWPIQSILTTGPQRLLGQDSSGPLIKVLGVWGFGHCSNRSLIRGETDQPDAQIKVLPRARLIALSTEKQKWALEGLLEK